MSRAVASISGGVVVIASDPGADRRRTTSCKGNVITGNQPDILTDGPGTGNVFFANVCDERPRRSLLSGEGCPGPHVDKMT